jgi:thymidylate synthase
MQNYLDLVKDIRTNGILKEDRTGTGTYSVFGRQLRFDLSKGRLPVVTTKEVHLKSIIHELLYFISGESNIEALREAEVKIWDPWVGDDGEAGPIYGVQWNHWKDTRLIDTDLLYQYESEGYKPLSSKIVKGQFVVQRKINQLKEAIRLLKEEPDSRRILVSAWNVAELEDMVLPPCHLLFQFYTTPLRTGDRHELFVNAFPERRGELERLKHQVTKGVTADECFRELENWFDQAQVPKRKLSCQLTMRSVDVGIGLPYNITSYALLTAMVAQVTGLIPDELIISTGDTHLYTNLIESLDLQLTREPLPSPVLHLNTEVTNLWAFRLEDIVVKDYNAHPAIKMQVSV